MELKLLNQDIDYNSIVRGNNLQRDIVKSKFTLFDDVIKNPSKYPKDAFYNLLQDDTLYTYAFFKDENGNPFKYEAYQDVIANLHHDFTPENPNRFILFKASNQIGKSALLCAKAAKIVNTEENKNIIMVSKSLPQSQFLLAQIKQTFNNSEFANTWREDLGDTANTTVLTFNFQRGKRNIINRIICAPAGEGLLGYPVHYLFLDELDFYDKGKLFFWKVAYPRTNRTKGQIIGFSNPNPSISRSESLLHELWTGDLFNRRFEFNFLDASWNTKSEFEIAKRNSPSHIFASTHMGMFSVDGGSFFSYKEIQDMLERDWINTLPSVDRPVYIALDLGKMNDQTVLSIGTIKEPTNPDDNYKDLNVHYMYDFPLRTDYDVIADKLKEIINHYEELHGVAIVGYDATGQKTFGDFLKRMGVSATPVDFAKKETNKTQLYNDFKLMVENRKIKVVYNKKAEKQLSELMFKLTETKKLKVEARTDSIHDDFPDCLAILINISVTPSKIPVSVTVCDPSQMTDGTDKDPNKPNETTDKELDAFYAQSIMADRNNYYNEQDMLRGGF